MELVSEFHRTFVESFAIRIKNVGALTAIAEMSESAGEQLEGMLSTIWASEKWPVDVTPSSAALRGLACDLLAEEARFYGQGDDRAEKFQALKKIVLTEDKPFDGEAPVLTSHTKKPPVCRSGLVQEDFSVFG